MTYYYVYGVEVNDDILNSLENKKILKIDPDDFYFSNKSPEKAPYIIAVCKN